MNLSFTTPIIIKKSKIVSVKYRKKYEKKIHRSMILSYDIYITWLHCADFSQMIICIYCLASGRYLSNLERNEKYL